MNDTPTRPTTAARSARSTRWRWRIRPGARSAIWGLIGVLLVAGALAVYSALGAYRLSQAATAAVRLSDAYADAAGAVAAAASLGRKYRLAPSDEVRQRYQATAASLRLALGNIVRLGGAGEVVLAERVAAEQAPFQQSMARLFAAVDRRDLAAVARIDEEETEPRFSVIESLVNQAADRNHELALTALAELDSQQLFYARATPLIFLVSLLLVGLFTQVLHRTRAQLERQRASASHAALHDALTGLPNRTLLHDRFEHALRAGQREGGVTGLMMLDMDRFKEVNDSLGHHFGDLLLTQLAQRLQAELRGADTIARLGGDEFAILLPVVADLPTALLTARRLRAALDRPFEIEGVTLDVEASIGVVVSGLHGTDPATLMKRADVAMYTAKQQGQGVATYTETRDQHSPERLAMLGQLRRGMDGGELFLQYQPKYDLQQGRAVGAEALLRWRHPERGLVPPGEFIPFAEQTGLIGPLTLYVLDLALAQVRLWLDAGQRIPVAVNISARNLLDERFAEQVTLALQAHRVPAELMELELTESAIMLEPRRAHELLGVLRRLGVRLAIDDFGAGYTSLAQLMNLPVTSLKIDRSFITALDTDADARPIVRSIIELGHTLGLDVVAEGIESAEVVARLAAMGCDQAQGFHLGRPTSASELTRLHFADALAAA